MKRSRIVVLTLAGLSLGTTGCNRPSGGIPGILPPDRLSPSVRASLPAYRPGADVSADRPPPNAYDPRLGYFHQPCNAWFPYPYDHYDSRWGYYRCGRWSRHSRPFVSTPFVRAPTFGPGLTSPSTPVADPTDYAQQPPGAPIHSGVAHGDATKTAASTTHRGGFGGTGRSTGFSSPS